MLDFHGRTRSQGYTPLDNILQFPDIPRKGIINKDIHNFGAYLLHLFPLSSGEFFQKVLTQKGDIVLSFRQAGHLQGDDVQAVIEVLAESTPFHLVFEVLIGGRQDADVHRNFPGAAHAKKGFVLEDPQEFGLHGKRHLGYFIQKNRALRCHFQQAFFNAPGPGEGLLFMAEQFMGQQFLGERTAVNGQKPLLGAAAQVVDGLGYQLLAGAGFS